MSLNHGGRFLNCRGTCQVRESVNIADSGPQLGRGQMAIVPASLDSLISHVLIFWQYL
jgi:hypothetical protein